MKEDRKIKNVVLIMLDTLQFNYLGCYGNKVVKTPNIDRLARQGFLFENAYSEGLPTVPVRRALMTGRFTLPYGGWQPLAPDDTTVADIMWGKNMQTALVYDTPPMRLPKYGYSRGFDFVSFNPGQELDHTSFADVPLDPALKPEDYTSPTMVFNEKGEVIDDDSTQLLDEIGCFLRQQQFRKPEDSYISRVMTDAQNWLSNRRDKTRPFLLWVDSFDPHEPWDPESVWKGEPCPYDPEYVGNPLVLAPHHGTRMRAHPRPVHGKDHAGGQVGGRTARLHPCSGALGRNPYCADVRPRPADGRRRARPRHHAQVPSLAV